MKEIPERLYFQHKLIHEFFAALFIADIATHGDIPEEWVTHILTFQDVAKYACGLLRGTEKADIFIDKLALFIVKNIKAKASRDPFRPHFFRNFPGQGLLHELQKEANRGPFNRYFSEYPRCGLPLNDILSRASFVYIDGSKLSELPHLTNETSLTPHSADVFLDNIQCHEQGIKLVDALGGSCKNEFMLFLQAFGSSVPTFTLPHSVTFLHVDSLIDDKLIDLMICESANEGHSAEYPDPGCGSGLLRNLPGILRECGAESKMKHFSIGPNAGSTDQEPGFVNHLAGLSLCNKLEVIRLSVGTIHKALQSGQVGFANHSSLKVLMMSGKEDWDICTEEMVLELAEALKLGKLPSLEDIDLSGNGLNVSATGPLLDGLSNCTKLIRVVLHGNHLHGCIGRFLVSDHPNLRVLDICRARKLNLFSLSNAGGLDEDDVRSIANAIKEGKLKSIEEIYIQDTELSETCIDDLLRIVFSKSQDLAKLAIHIEDEHKENMNITDQFRKSWIDRFSNSQIELNFFKESEMQMLERLMAQM